MIRFNIQRYIRNRIWFGWWYNYFLAVRKWERDPRYIDTPVALTRETVVWHPYFSPDFRYRIVVFYDNY